MDRGWVYVGLLLVAVTGGYGQRYVQHYGQHYDQRYGQHYDPDFGPFCGRFARPLCCTSREDQCNMTRGYGLMETECYCDEFCVHTHPGNMPDCCPDYWEVCRGEVSKYCYHRDSGAYYKAGSSFKDNCHSCSCIDMGDHMEISCERRSKCIVDVDLIKEVNRRPRGWVAGNVTQFWGRDLETDGYNGMLGTLYASKKVRSMYAKSSRATNFERSFDSRNEIATTPIVNQNFCNASWSYAIVSTFTDRLIKWSNARLRGPLSYQQHRNCVNLRKRMNEPCRAGKLTDGWKYLSYRGLTTEDCYPETGRRACEISPSRGSKTVVCPRTGRRSGRLYWASFLSRVTGEAAMMSEIKTDGPILATMRVFHEFFLYTGGVYDCPAGVNPKQGRLHTVKIVGWGEEMVNIGREYVTVPYWIVANSWGTGWGENGYFKIRRGVNACDIEEFNLSFYMTGIRQRRSPRLKNPFL